MLGGTNMSQLANNVTPFAYSLACHAGLVSVLRSALQRAVYCGLVSESEAGELLALAAARDSAVLRIACEKMLESLREEPLGSAS